MAQDPGKRTRKQTLTMLAVLGAAIVVLGMKCRESIQEDAERAAAAEAAKPTLEVLADDLWKAFDANEIAAEKKYKDARLLVGGVVSSISGGIMSPQLDLHAGPGSRVLADLQASEKDNAAKLQRGSRVLLVCDGGQKTIGIVNLSRCKIGKFEN